MNIFYFFTNQAPLTPPSSTIAITRFGGLCVAGWGWIRCVGLPYFVLAVLYLGLAVPDFADLLAGPNLVLILVLALVSIDLVLLHNS